ncbi:MAG TPA: ACP S-malonyltransferase [Acidobacteriaceae bacterium]|nr:ACP S-malonyltransferase [Acidobacteriaceae bacterium]
MTDTNDNTQTSPKIALLFPGQGSQFVGMGRALYDTVPAARAIFDEADAAVGFPLSKLIFEGPEEDLKLTENTQPAILTVSIAALRALEPELKRRNLTVAFAAGHSLGEYAAHVAAGTFTFAEAVRTVKARGRFMQEAVPAGQGAMAAILGMSAARINDICARVEDELSPPPDEPGNPSAQSAPAIDALNDPNNPAETAIQAAASVAAVVAPANLNSPEQTVISGSKQAVERASALCKEAGAKRALMLPVSAPFHCKLMQPAEEQLAGVLEAITFNDPAFPVAANVDARLLRRGSEARDALIRQVTGAVRWVECIQLLTESGATHFIEVGPGKVLQGLNHKIDKNLVTCHVDSPANLEKALAVFHA